MMLKKSADRQSFSESCDHEDDSNMILDIYSFNNASDISASCIPAPFFL